MTRREFLLALPASAGLPGCLGLDPRFVPATPADAADLSAANAAFAFELFGQLGAVPGNVVCSPFSVAAALALTSAAASDATLDEFHKVLHWTGPADALHPAFATVQRQIAAGTARSGCELRAAYGIWTAKTLDVRSEFRKVAQNCYDGAWQSADFDDPNAAARAVNHWAQLQTSFKIRELVKPDEFSSATRLFLAEAVYFKGLWAKTFPRAATTYDSFHSAGGAKSPALFMQQKTRHRLTENESWQALELPFAGGALAMLVILPRSVGALPALQASLTVERLDQLLHDLQPRPVVVSLPRFRVVSDLRLTEPLQALGLKRAFQPGEAEFSRLCREESIALQAVVQKATVDVTEDGAEATAVTGAAATTIATAKSEPEPAIFQANRPFLFAVRDATSGSVLFLGRVEKPT